MGKFKPNLKEISQYSFTAINKQTKTYKNSTEIPLINLN